MTAPTESVFLWIGYPKGDAGCTPDSLLACPFSCVPEDREETLATIASRYEAHTLGVLPESWLDMIARPLRAPGARPRIAIVSLPKQARPEASLEDSLSVDYEACPETGLSPDLLTSWAQGHPDRLFLGAYTGPMLDSLLAVCAEIGSSQSSSPDGIH